MKLGGGVKFSCETPLNEMDTCDVLGFYFGEVYYAVSDEDFLSEKVLCRKWAEI